MTFKDCIAKELFIVVNYKRSMQSFPMFIFYSVKRERERGEKKGCKMFAKRLLGFTHTFTNASLYDYPTGWLLVLRSLLGSFYIAIIPYAAVFVSSRQFFTTDKLGRCDVYISKRLEIR